MSFEEFLGYFGWTLDLAGFAELTDGFVRFVKFVKCYFVRFVRQLKAQYWLMHGFWHLADRFH